MTNVIVCGCFGRLGAAICTLAEDEAYAVKITAGVDEMPANSGFPYPIFTDIHECQLPADAVIVCLRPSHTAMLLAAADYCAHQKIPLLMCTTGLSDEVLQALKKTALHTAVLISANLSLGINLLASLLNKTAKLLYEANFDIEIIEKHHNQKLDAPSGTALLLADTVKQAVGGNLRYTHDRSTRHTKRSRVEIGLHTLRGGTITGEHSVIFAGLDEVIELKHSALSRNLFAVGACKAAHFIKNMPPGLYSMQDVIK
jgi:4-hydroxy-tetrahydrodipicolinate reductase